jgi:peroxiredoxin
MKKLILIAALSLPILASAQTDTFTIEGKVSNPASQSKAYLIYRAAGKNVIDSAELKDGGFSFSGKVTVPTSATLTLAHTGSGLRSIGKNPDNYTLYLDQGTVVVNVKDSIKNATISGAKLSVEYVKYIRTFSAQTLALGELDKIWAASTAEQKKEGSLALSLRTKLAPIAEAKQKIQRDYIQKSPDSYFSLMAIKEIAGSPFDADKVDPLFGKLSAGLKSSIAGEAFAKQLAKAKTTSVGAMAPDFAQANVDGKEVKLSDFRGKYVLLDFWASWCGPCREENPNVVANFHKFKGRNFTVLGVSLDNPGKREDWLKAIANDKLEWEQLSDLLGWKNAVAGIYSITSIPQNFLIDPSGKIIARNIRGEELGKKLNELLATKTK